MRFLFNKFFLFLLIACFIFYWAYSYFTGKPLIGMGGMHGEGPPVSVAEPILRDTRLWHEFSGRLVAVDHTEIRPRVSGTIEKIHFEEGQWVEKDQPLFTIDPRSYEAALQAARAQAVFTQAELKRAKELVSDRAVAKRDYDQRRAAAEIAAADLKRAELDFEYTTVRSPVAGHVGRPEITVGNLVDSGGNAPVLTTVVSDRPIYADFSIDEQTFLLYLNHVGAATDTLKNIPVSLWLSDAESQPHTGRVQSFDNQLDVRSGTIRVRAIFENADGKLIPGLFARVRLGEPQEIKALLITDRAVNTDQNKKYVLVVGKDNMVEYRPVTLGAMVDGLRQVNSGLQLGEKIIVNGLQRARPGTPVTPELVPMEEKETAPAAPNAPESEDALPKDREIQTMPVEPKETSPVPAVESSPAMDAPLQPEAVQPEMPEVPAATSDAPAETKPGTEAKP